MTDWKFEADDFPMWESTHKNHFCRSYMIEVVNSAIQTWLASAKTVFAENDNGFGGWHLGPRQDEFDTHQALLIKIEPIKKCEHPKEKVTKINNHVEGGLVHQGFVPGSVEAGVPLAKIPKKDFFCCIGYQCECGARVEPVEFREVKA